MPPPDAPAKGLGEALELFKISYGSFLRSRPHRRESLEIHRNAQLARTRNAGSVSEAVPTKSTNRRHVAATPIRRRPAQSRAGRGVRAGQSHPQAPDFAELY